MLRIYVLLAAFMFMTKERAAEAKKDERGVTTLELVVIGLGLLLLATAAVAVIKLAVDSRLDSIK